MWLRSITIGLTQAIIAVGLIGSIGTVFWLAHLLAFREVILWGLGVFAGNFLGRILWELAEGCYNQVLGQRGKYRPY